MTVEPSRAVFLSYASQGVEAAQRLCEVLRAAGIEVWFDRNELVGGDAWDRKIRKQIAECALFLPIISANTQARLEGYFRLEWKFAEDRSHLMAKGRAFLVPIVIDATSERDAHVPDAFLAVQRTRLPGAGANAAFCDQVKRLLGGDAGRSRPTPPPQDTTPTAAGSGDSALQRSARRVRWLRGSWWASSRRPA
jgi:hypothetical protein